MPAPAAPASQSAADVIRWQFELINDHDLAPMREYWSPAIHGRFPDADLHGPDAYLAHFAMLWRALPDFHLDPHAVVGEGDTVFAAWRLTGTHTGPGFAGLEPTGRRIELDGIDHFTLSDGKVATEVVVFDQMAVARALGMLPPDGSPADRAMKSAFNAKTKLGELIKQARG